MNNLGPACRICRREGMKLFLKGFRCESPKCSLNKRVYPPGAHQWKRKPSEYGRQLREKQKVKRFYGIVEKQFMLYFKEASRVKGNTGETLMRLLELRLDNVVCHLGFAQSRKQAKQIICHRHILLNGKRVRTSSISVKRGDKITVHDDEKVKKYIRENMDFSKTRGVPSWLTLDEKNLSAEVVNLPDREQVTIPVEEHLIVEFCSK